MKITIVQGAFLPVPAIQGGAVEKVWFTLGQEFARAGHTVTHLSKRHPDLPDSEVQGGVQHRRIPGFAAPDSLLRLKALDLAYSLRALRELPPADVLVTNTFWLPMLVSRAAQRRVGRLYVHVARYPKGQMRFYRHAARLQTVSTPIAQAISKESADVAPLVRVVPYPLPGPLPVSLPHSNDRRGRDNTATSTILYVGRVHPEKGIELLLKSFQKLKARDCRYPPVRLRIVGPWETELGGGGQAFLTEMQRVAPPGVEWVGPVFGESALAAEFQAADAFVYPSVAERGETFGLAPLEAMGHGCPPVVSDLACFQDFVTHGKNGLIFNHRESGDGPVVGLSAALETMLRDVRSGGTLRASAFATAGNYSPRTIAHRFLEDFHEVCSV